MESSSGYAFPSTFAWQMKQERNEEQNVPNVTQTSLAGKSHVELTKATWFFAHRLIIVPLVKHGNLSSAIILFVHPHLLVKEHPSLFRPPSLVFVYSKTVHPCKQPEHVSIDRLIMLRCTYPEEGANADDNEQPVERSGSVSSCRAASQYPRARAPERREYPDRSEKGK